MTDNYYTEVKAARAYAMNKSVYASEVRKKYEVAWTGLHATTGNIGKLLNLRRVSAAGLASVGSGTSDISRVLGSEVIFKDAAVPLVATPVVSDAVLALEGRLRAVEDAVKEASGRQYTIAPTSLTLLGTMEMKLANRDYVAETDGFVMAYSGGNSLPERFLVFSGGHAVARADEPFTSRMAVIKKGMTWRVSGRGKDNQEVARVKDLNVYWVPLQAPALAIEVKK